MVAARRDRVWIPQLPALRLGISHVAVAVAIAVAIVALGVDLHQRVELHRVKLTLYGAQLLVNCKQLQLHLAVPLYGIYKIVIRVIAGARHRGPAAPAAAIGVV